MVLYTTNVLGILVSNPRPFNQYYNYSYPKLMPMRQRGPATLQCKLEDQKARDTLWHRPTLWPLLATLQHSFVSEAASSD
ncbi:hypothetical protein VNO77_29520 [Canavalia gladiata]|uniref:Uncharacterized protein n=1 Tax=Canavalia gladiata TaxID=3824 RepID=A0AAN9L1P0_CANGL